jgi:aminopeptidase N
LAVLRGGSALLSTATEVAPAEPQEKFRKDYTPPPYRVDSLTLNFDIHEEETLVTSTLNIEPSADAAGKLDLDGEELSLRSIEVDGKALVEGTDYKLTEEGLSLLLLPVAAFKLTTVVAIKPQETRLPSRGGGHAFCRCAAPGLVRCWSRFRLHLACWSRFLPNTKIAPPPARFSYRLRNCAAQRRAAPKARGARSGAQRRSYGAALN